MSKSVKAVIIAAAALAVLAGVLVLILFTEPEKNVSDSSSHDAMSGILSYLGEDGDGLSVITNYEVDTVTELAVTNAAGGYTLTRKERDGEFYFYTDDLGEVLPDEEELSRNVDLFARLAGTAPIEENVTGEALEKYGLRNPLGEARLTIEDGTVVTLSFGIHNPAKEENVYCTLGDGAVFQVGYANIMTVFGDARPLAKLILTEEAEDAGQPERIEIIRENAGTHFELRYMSELDNIPDDDSVTVSANSYRFVEPIRAEVDAQRASALYSNLCGLKMYSCEFLEKSEENLKACGLDTPQTEVRFLYNGEERVLLLGNELIKLSPSGKEVECFYAAVDGTAGIFSIDKRRAVWSTFGIFDSVSKRPISPYIYACESVEITTPSGHFKFVIDDVGRLFSLDGELIDPNAFKELYSKLIGEVGDELFTEVTDGEPTVKVKFNYRDEYREYYGGQSDVLEYLAFDGRRYVVNFNGNTLFKVNGLYVDGLIEGVDRLVNN